jgi:hypothetical protein
MASDVVLHLMLELMGGLTLRCFIGRCTHNHHRAVRWTGLFLVNLLLAITTVIIVG